MNGRLESELNKQKVIKAKLAKLPPIFTEFYSYMEEDDRSSNTIEHYIDYNIEFMEYITKGNKDGIVPTLLKIRRDILKAI